MNIQIHFCSIPAFSFTPRYLGDPAVQDTARASCMMDEWKDVCRTAVRLQVSEGDTIAAQRPGLCH